MLQPAINNNSTAEDDYNSFAANNNVQTKYFRKRVVKDFTRTFPKETVKLNVNLSKYTAKRSVINYYSSSEKDDEIGIDIIQGDVAPEKNENRLICD